MTTLNLIIWISVYSICLVHIALFAIIYSRHKNKIELFYLIVLITIFLLAVTIMVSLILEIKNVVPIIVYSILLLYITVPIYGYHLFGVHKNYYKLIPVLIIIEAAGETFFMLRNNFSLVYLSRIIFYILFLAPIFFNARKYPKDSLEQIMQDVTKKTVVIFLFFMIVFVPFSIYLFEISYVPSLWWAAFTLSYQIPGLVYCYKYLRKRDELPNLQPGLNAGSYQQKSLQFQKEMPALTKRENEVAQAICSGLKYEDIAQKLFISLSAVKKHAYSIYQKLGINNNRELMQIFMETQKNDIV